MITELKEVIQKVESLTDHEQRTIAKMIDEELEWDKTLYKTQDKLAILAKEALEEYNAKRIR